MSTVLWANRLTEAEVTSDEQDRYALYRHTGKLDRICRALGLPPFSGLCDTTDAQVNLGTTDLPQGMHSTTELMARQGVWTGAEEAVRLLESLLAHIQQNGTRFGLLRNDHDQVVAELQESIAFARDSAEAGARFNFCVVS